MPQNKSHPSYWMSRVERRSGGRNYSFRLVMNGRRTWFTLHTSAQKEAAARASEIYAFALANGVDSAIQKFGSHRLIHGPQKPADHLTIGELLESAEKVTTAKKRTFDVYRGKLRTIVAGIMGFESDSRKFGNQGREQWRKQIDSVPLAKITPKRINAWRAHYINNGDDLTRDQRKRTANGYLRNARNLFRVDLLEMMDLNLPSPLPFDGVKVEPVRPTKYVSSINAPALVVAANRELEGNQRLAVLLALCAGLRREEIDSLTWPQIQLLGNRPGIEIRQTPHFIPKSESSCRFVDIDPGFAAFLRNAQAAAGGEFVIEGTSPRPGARYAHYRAHKDYAAAVAWLRSKGIQGRAPLHALRKEWGSMVNAVHGLKEASVGLGHANIGITASTYVDSRKPLLTGVGDALAHAVSPSASAKAGSI